MTPLCESPSAQLNRFFSLADLAERQQKLTIKGNSSSQLGRLLLAAARLRRPSLAHLRSLNSEAENSKNEIHVKQNSSID